MIQTPQSLQPQKSPNGFYAQADRTFTRVKLYGKLTLALSIAARLAAWLLPEKLAITRLVIQDPDLAWENEYSAKLEHGEYCVE